MLDPWIIEEIRRREEDERRERERPVLEIPLDVPAYPRPPSNEGKKPDDVERGVVIVDFAVF